MKRFPGWQFLLAVALLSLSGSIYFIDVMIFHDFYHTAYYFLGDLAFLFVEVLLVTIIIHNLLAMRERRSMLKKLNMVIGAFFSEAGTHLMRSCSGFDPAFAQLAAGMVVTNTWSDKEFAAMKRQLASHPFSVDHAKGDLEAMKGFLAGKRQFLLGLLENANLLEHESFTNLMWAVFHLTEELIHRHELKGLPETDYRHLEGDVQRVYRLIVEEWLAYMKHLKSDYPYLFSLAVRTNPFDAHASIVVR